ncbi:hypothetical protein C3Z13_03005, partial [Avibacterium endocarditidis]
MNRERCYAGRNFLSSTQTDCWTWRNRWNVSITANFTSRSYASREFTSLQKDSLNTALSLTPEDKVTGYNNFYEFGIDKGSPAQYAHTLKTAPWQVEISGEIEKPLILDLQDLYTRYPLQERIYRFRCVEAWAMVIPWIGFELNALLREVRPTSRAKYVEFETLYDPEQMPGQK